MSSANSCSKKTKVKIQIYSQDTISGVGCSLYKENAPVYSFKNTTPLGSDNMALSTQICHGGSGVPPALPPPQLSFQADEVRENDSMKQVKPGKTVRGNIQQGRRGAQAMGRKVPKTLHLAANVHCSFSEFPDPWQQTGAYLELQHMIWSLQRQQFGRRKCEGVTGKREGGWREAQHSHRT